MTGLLVLIAEDHPIFREAVVAGLAAKLPQLRFAEAASLADCLESLRREAPALILLDLDIPGAEGLSGLVDIRAEFPNAKVIILSATDTPVVVTKTMALGASGFVSKASSASTMAAAIEDVLSGSAWITTTPLNAVSASAIELRLATLTPQQLKILRLVTRGLMNKQIAGELAIQEQTVKEHLSQIFRKLDVQTRTQAALIVRDVFRTVP